VCPSVPAIPRLHRMAAPPASLARRQPVGRTLSESFAVIAYRKQTLAVRHGPKLRGVLLIFGCETLCSRQTVVTIRHAFRSMARFWRMTGHMVAEVWLVCGPFVNPCGAPPEAARGLLNAQWHTFHGEAANLSDKAHLAVDTTRISRARQESN
jgi:hypothetical protein